MTSNNTLITPATQSSVAIINPPQSQIGASQDIPAKADLSFQSMKTYLRVSYLMLFVLVAVIGGWSYFSKIQGAVIASGSIAVDGDPQLVQHIEGGIVSEIYVQEGDFVELDTPVLKLDASLIDANRIAAQTNYYANEVLISRLLSEQKQRQKIEWLETVKSSSNEAVIIAKATEESFFVARQISLKGEVTGFEQNISQLKDEDRGIISEIEFTLRELNLIEPELFKLNRLLERNLISRTRLTELERQQTRLLNQHAQLQNRRQLIAGSIREARLNIQQLYKTRQEEVLSLLTQARTRADSFSENLEIANRRTQQIFVRAPRSGYVHKMSVKTVGGVISSGQEIMQIIPKRKALLMTARVTPQDIDQVSIGQNTNVIFSSLNLDAPPELQGTVSFISPDSILNEFDGSPYYTVNVKIAETELSKLEGQVLKPGVPADIFIQTQKRTVLQYILDPLRKNLRRTMRDA